MLLLAKALRSGYSPAPKSWPAGRRPAQAARRHPQTKPEQRRFLAETGALAARVEMRRIFVLDNIEAFALNCVNGRHIHRRNINKFYEN
jgi:hypothetical protein